MISAAFSSPQSRVSSPACPSQIFHRLQAYGAGLPQRLHPGIGNPKDSFHQQATGRVLAGFLRPAQPDIQLGVRYDVEFPPKFNPPDALALAAYNYLGLQKGIQTDTNNIQPRSAWPGIPKAMARPWSARPTEFFTITRCSVCISWEMLPTDRTSGQLAFAGTGHCSCPGQPGNLNAIPIFQGLPINLAQCTLSLPPWPVPTFSATCLTSSDFSP